MVGPPERSLSSSSSKGFMSSAATAAMSDEEPSAAVPPTHHHHAVVVDDDDDVVCRVECDDERRDDLSSSGSSSCSSMDFGPPDVELGREKSGRHSGRDNEEPIISKEFHWESRAVSCLKISVIAMLVCATVTVTTLVHHFNRQDEIDDFHLQYEDFSLKVMGAFEQNMDMKIWTAETVSAMYTSRYGIGSAYYQGHGYTWPNITMNNFPQQTAGGVLLAHTLSINFAPVVTNETRLGWEQYATERWERMKNFSSFISDKGRTFGDCYHCRKISDGIYRFDGDVMVDEDNYDDELYLPVWQVSPPVNNQAGLMYNQASDPILRSAINYMMGGRWALTDICYLDIDHHTGRSHHEEPSSVLFFPVFDRFVGARTADGGKPGSGASVVGAISIVFSWKSYFSNILPVKMGGMICVLESSSGSKFTFEIDGGDVTFIGFGDYHDESYDGMVRTLKYNWLRRGTGEYDDRFYQDYYNMEDTFVVEDEAAHKGIPKTLEKQEVVQQSPGDGNRELRRLQNIRDAIRKEKENGGLFGQSHNTGNTTAHTGRPPHVQTPDRGSNATHTAPSDEMFSPEYTLRIYPSEAMKNHYTSNKPIMFSLGVAMIFFFTSALFLLYDYLVEYRQNLVMETAIRSTKIVHQLFPHTVRRRLFEPETVINEPSTGVSTHNLSSHDPSSKRLAKFVPSPTTRLGHFMRKTNGSSMSVNETDLSVFGSGPIADMFTETTILFADIAGFTKWSSEREPHQVFELLENVYGMFDKEAKNLGVFKVETIGDCYVAVTGLPDPMKDHALVMARFAQKCLDKMTELTNRLELSLGPGTSELGMRFGLHSGPVTAGVLRGDKSRFQLFGDTMNTASRIESTGKKNMIQCSQDTADLIIEGGKGHWLTTRDGLVTAKGKGQMQAYWINVVKSAKHRASKLSSSGGSDGTESDFQRSSQDPGHFGERESIIPGVFLPPGGGQKDGDTGRRDVLRNQGMVSWRNLVPINPHHPGGILKGRQNQAQSTTVSPSSLERLIKWNVAVLESHLVKILAHRKMNAAPPPRSLQRRRSLMRSTSPHALRSSVSSLSSADSFILPLSSIQTSEAVQFPGFTPKAAEIGLSESQESSKNKQETTLTEEAKSELHQYVSRIASMYRDVHFHNFEHASHVTMSANKLMNKVCGRGADYDGRGSKSKESEVAMMRNRGVDRFFSTYGISSDPLAQFTVVFAALVHDVDHTGVPNIQLVNEGAEIANRYNNQSVAERNSIQVAWEMLMKPEFSNLRSCLFGDKVEMRRFRLLLVNVVMATDIADEDRMEVEKKRWEKAFSNVSNWENEWRNKTDEELSSIDVSMKATLALEQIMLASDVSHTMQHWFTFLNWNERLYKELYAAHDAGRSAQGDPSINWYENQISFFDGYIIPLGKKLKECGVFGTAGDEYLGNALKNRQEWLEKGKEISARMVEKVTGEHGVRMSKRVRIIPAPIEEDHPEESLSTVSATSTESNLLV